MARFRLAAIFVLGVGLAFVAGANASWQHLPASSPYGECRAWTNIAYATNPDPRQNFDLYEPAGSNDHGYLLIFWIHGGAWTMGLKDWDNVKYLVRHGYAIASVDYRVAPEHPFPDAVKDCNLALDFILAHATGYGLDAKRVVIGGGSAGGNLALLIGLARDEKTFAADSSVRPLAILDFFGPTDFDHLAGDLREIHSDNGLKLLQEVAPKYLGQSAETTSAKSKAASPVSYVQAGNPPVLIVHGEKDDLVPVAQSRRLETLLSAANITNRFILVKGAGHDGPMFSTPEIASNICEFLAEVVPGISNQVTSGQNTDGR